MASSSPDWPAVFAYPFKLNGTGRLVGASSEALIGIYGDDGEPISLPNIEVVNVPPGDYINATDKIIGSLNLGGLSKADSPKFRSMEGDVSILAEAKARGLPLFTNNAKDFLITVPGGGQLAEKLGSTQ